MGDFLLCISLLILSLGTYIIWPSRYNVLQHLAVGGSFVTIVVPALILSVQDQYEKSIVNLYIWILCVGAISFLSGLITGFTAGRNIRTRFSFDLMDFDAYEERTVKITRNFMIFGIAGMVISYLVMGFVPVFAADPISAKLFRGQYQAPYIRVAFLFRTAFFILATLMPIACIIWYKFRTKLFLFIIIASILLMAASLARSGAFMGVVIAFAIVMAFKSRVHFLILMSLLVGVFVLSSFFYYIVGVRTYSNDKNIWEIITAGTPDIPDQLDFLTRFEEKEDWTYGRTIYGGLIPGHYKWNPAVYTLVMVNPGQDINDIGSGGLRLPLPVWGYVSFEWTGVILFSLLTGFLTGVCFRMIKTMFAKFESILTRTVIIIGFGAVVGIIANFTQLSIYNIPPAIVSLFYLYRFRLK